MAQNSFSPGTLEIETDFGERNRLISASNVSKMRAINGTVTFFNGLCRNNYFSGNVELSKMRSIQCYEVLWIHNIDANCMC